MIIQRIPVKVNETIVGYIYPTIMGKKYRVCNNACLFNIKIETEEYEYRECLIGAADRIRTSKGRIVGGYDPILNEDYRFTMCPGKNCIAEAWPSVDKSIWDREKLALGISAEK